MSGSSISNGGFLCCGGGRLTAGSSNCDEEEDDAMIGALASEFNSPENLLAIFTAIETPNPSKKLEFSYFVPPIRNSAVIH